MCPPVIQRKNVVQLHVDTVDNYKIGPPLSTPNSTKSSLYLGGIPGEWLGPGRGVVGLLIPFPA